MNYNNHKIQQDNLEPNHIYLKAKNAFFSSENKKQNNNFFGCISEGKTGEQPPQT